MEKTISTAETRQRFAELLDEVRTERVTYRILRHGQEVARLNPPGIAASDAGTTIDQEAGRFIDRYRDQLRRLADL